MNQDHLKTPREQPDLLRGYPFADRVDRIGSLVGWLLFIGVLGALLLL